MINDVMFGGCVVLDDRVIDVWWVEGFWKEIKWSWWNHGPVFTFMWTDKKYQWW